jgi:hypothetical protein
MDKIFDKPINYIKTLGLKNQVSKATNSTGGIKVNATVGITKDLKDTVLGVAGFISLAVVIGTMNKSNNR